MTSPQTERQQSVLDLLQNLKGQDPLKKLFWTELNYDRVNSPLSRKGWGEQASSALADDPVLFATGGNDFHVIHARLKTDRPLMGMERPVVSRLLQDHPYALFIFSNANQDQWHFLNVKYDDDVQKRRIFRRIAIGPQEKLRTASERLDKINLADATNLAPNTIQKLHDDAFDVEPVTKEFFHEYGRIFDEVESAIKGIRDAERKRLFTQRLFNRLMFVAFIQKKGWLKFAGSTDYLSALWKAHERDTAISDKNCYRDRLKPLFFFGLNSTNDVNQIGINRGAFLKTLIGDVPYLNGGLFDEDDDDKDEKIIVPDKAIDAVLNDLFARFNFTVTESTPLDVEVAGDPEMLGKIFEELVTGRHETGSYYTPKPIVSFMCREALKGYLLAKLPNESRDAVKEFVDEHSPTRLHNAEAVLEALRRIKVCDPACGSGAYFFLSGLESIGKSLAHVKELRLLIGNTTNQETLEQLAEGYRRLELVSEKAEEEAYPKKTEIKRMAEETASNIRSTVELMDQSDDAEALLKILVRLIEEKRLKVKVYTKGRFHAKAYIFDYADMFDVLGNKVERHENGIAIIGSSNLTLAGVSHNTELNVVVQGNNNHAELGRWFDELWNESEDFDETLMREMQQSWAVAPLTPYDIYMKTLYALVKDRLEDEDDRDILWDDDITRKLADFQKVAVRQAVQITRDFGGAFVADVVGLGKSYIGAAIVKHFERTDHARPLIICPAPLVEMWELYNDAYQLNARVLSMGYLYEGGNGTGNILLDDAKYRDRDFVLVDESHNFRHSDTQRYKILQGFLSTGERKVCFLTATPRNKSAWDVYYQIKLFHQDDKTDLPVDPADLKQYFKLIEGGDRRLPDLLAHILIRRTRNHILRWYGYDSVTHQPIDPSRFREYMDGDKRAYVLVAGKHQFFPRRELDTIEYSIEDTYSGLYQELRGCLGKPRKTTPRSSPSRTHLRPLWVVALRKEDKTKTRTLRQLAQGRSQSSRPDSSPPVQAIRVQRFCFSGDGATAAKDTQHFPESPRRGLRSRWRGCPDPALRVRP